MINGNANKSFLFKWKKNRMEYSMGLFVYYFGTRKTYNDVEHHTIKFGSKYKEHLDDIFNKKKLNTDIAIIFTDLRQLTNQWHLMGKIVFTF